MTLTNDAAASAQLAICHREMCQGRPAAVLLFPVNTQSFQLEQSVQARTEFQGKKVVLWEERRQKNGTSGKVKTANKFINHGNSKIRE